MGNTQMFRYALYSEPQLGNVQHVAGYVNRLARSIHLEYGGDLAVHWQADGPFSADSIESPPAELQNPDKYSILITRAPSDACWSSTKTYAVVFDSAYPSDEGLQPIHYFVYLILAAILNHEETKRLGILTDDWVDWKNQHATANAVKAGYLPDNVVGALEKLVMYEPELLDLVNDVRLVAGNIRNAYGAASARDTKTGQEERTADQRRDYPLPGHVGDDRPTVPSPKRSGPNQKETVRPTATREPQGERARTGGFGVHSDVGDTQDALGFERYAQAFADIAADFQTSTPFTVGIYARWGRGKTALMRFIKKHLPAEQEATTWWRALPNRYSFRVWREDTTARPYRCLPIDVNAWELSRTRDVWAEVYSRILDDVERQLGVFQKVWFRARFAWHRSQGRFAAAASVVIAAVSLLVIGLFYGSDIADMIGIGNSNSVRLTSVVSALTALTPLLVKYLSAISTQVFAGYRKPHGGTRPGSQQASMSTVHKATRALARVTRGMRIVVFVDDIDRCPHKKILAVIEAIKLFLESERFVFFLAMEPSVVRRAIGSHYRFMFDHEEGREHDLAVTGRQYLEKIIQVPFNLPPLSPQQRLDLNQQLIASLHGTSEEQNTGSSTPSRPRMASGGSGEAGPPRSTSTHTEAASDESSQPSNEPADPTRPTATPSPGEEDTIARSKLTKVEIDVLEAILTIEEYDVSPRLWKRFVNIYLVARHLFIQSTVYSDLTSPPESFIKWLALSILYPFESRALLEWFETHDWQNPFVGKRAVFTTAGYFRSSSYSGDVTTGGHHRNPFSALNEQHLSKFGHLLLALNINRAVVQETRYITDCFNLAQE